MYRRYLLLSCAFVGVALRTALQYRVHAIMYGLADIIAKGVWLVVLAIIVSRFQGVGGWSTAEVVLLAGYGMTVLSLFATLLGGVTQLAWQVQSGELDSVLLLPVNPLAVLIMRTFTPSCVVSLVPGVALMFEASRLLFPDRSALVLVSLLPSLVGSTLVLFGMHLAVASSSFWTTRADALAEVLDATANQFSQYPLTIFGRPVQVLLTCLPLGFLSYYPCAAVVGQGRHVRGLCASPWATLLAGLVAGVCGYCVWIAGLRRYRGTGT